ncbi:MAG TPA: DUF2142 domain-containing protein [Acidimicrobiales bacterium]|nr:DUF2142 domain-containing protein [Acidimicrobiales bacterium]
MHDGREVLEEEPRPAAAERADDDAASDADTRSASAVPTHRAERRAFLRRWLAAFLLVATFSTAWSMVTPPAGGPDEQYHAIKGAAVVTGQFTGRFDPVLGGGATFVEVSARWERLDHMPGCFAFHPEIPADCAGELDGPTGDKDVRTRAGITPPFFHGMVGAPMHFMSTLDGFYLSRLIGSLVAAVMVATALTLAATARSWFLVGAVLVSWTPMAAFLSGVINPSSLEISAATLLWVSGLLLVRPDGVPEWVQRRLVWFFAGAAIPFVLTRQPSPILLACIVAVLVVAAPWARVRALIADRRVWLPAGLVASAAVGAVVWLLANPLGPGGDKAVVVYGRRDMITVPLRRVDIIYEQMIGLFGWLDTRPPSFVRLGWTAVITLLVVLGVAVGPRRLAVATGAATVVSLCFYVGLEGSLLRQTGPVFQGRYLLPLAMGIVMLAGRGVDESAPERRRRLLPALGVVVGITAAAQLVAIWFGARRFAVGSDGAVWFVGDARWQPDIPQAVSLLVAVVAITGLVVWVWTAVRGDAARERARTVRA